VTHCSTSRACDDIITDVFETDGWRYDQAWVRPVTEADTKGGWEVVIGRRQGGGW